MEDFFKHRIADDSVQYCLYLTNYHYINNESYAESLLNDYLHKCLALILRLTSNHIWQNDPFNLHVVTKCNLPHITGITNFGDSIDDEWLIVYLLLEITRTFSDLIACVHDNDGQFLLIEAAEHIPKWLTPDTCQNRVFIYGGNIHILLKPSNPGNIVFCPVISPTLEHALYLVTKYSSETVAHKNIGTCIDLKVTCFPKKICNDIHFTNVFIPKKLAYMLDQRPNFISKCVNAFYLRDPIALRACRTFKYMNPCERVWTQVPMTRFHYSQLMQQYFSPDKHSGYQIPTGLTVAEEKGFDLGLKLAHGCEIIFSSKYKENSQFNFKKFFDKNDFPQFINSLKKYGYFNDELEGSKLYQELLNKAKDYYLNAFDSIVTDQKYSSAIIDVFCIFDSLQSDDNAGALERLQIQSSLYDLPKESCDQWMYLNQNDVQVLAEKMNQGFASLNKSNKSDNKSKSYKYSNEQNQLKEAVDKINNFVSDVSDYTGVEVDDKSQFNFNSKEFVSNLEKILDIQCSTSKDNNIQISDCESDDFMSSDDNTFISDSDVENNDSLELKEYMQYMDNELANTAIGKSFVKAEVQQQSRCNTNDCSVAQVDIETNLLENFLLGKNEERSTGPINNILGSVHADLPLIE